VSRFIAVALLMTGVPALVFGLAAAEPNAVPQPPSPGVAPPPSEPEPSEAPPPPPAVESTLPPGPQESSPPAAPPSNPTPGAPPGQWVYTNQYGWLWMPYAKQYTYISSDPQVYPYEYVYYPVYGWRWVVAPWVYGYGPLPYWGAWGPRYFVWYAHPWFRVGGYWGWGGYRGWGRYHGWIGPHAWGARGWVRAPAYYRTGVGWPQRPAARVAPVHRYERPDHRW